IGSIATEGKWTRRECLSPKPRLHVPSTHHGPRARQNRPRLWVVRRRRVARNAKGSHTLPRDEDRPIQSHWPGANSWRCRAARYIWESRDKEAPCYLSSRTFSKRQLL